MWREEPDPTKVLGQGPRRRVQVEVSSRVLPSLEPLQSKQRADQAPPSWRECASSRRCGRAKRNAEPSHCERFVVVQQKKAIVLLTPNPRFARSLWLLLRRRTTLLLATRLLQTEPGKTTDTLREELSLKSKAESEGAPPGKLGEDLLLQELVDSSLSWTASTELEDRWLCCRPLGLKSLEVRKPRLVPARPRPIETMAEKRRLGGCRAPRRKLRSQYPRWHARTEPRAAAFGAALACKRSASPPSGS